MNYSPYSSELVANRFLELSNIDNIRVNNIKLQKLIYIANGLCLGHLDRRLTYHKVYAWSWGPVFPATYVSLSFYKNDSFPPNTYIPTVSPKINVESDEFTIINDTWDKLKEYSNAQLFNIISNSNDPWSQIYKVAPHTEIPTELIRRYFAKLTKTD